MGIYAVKPKFRELLGSTTDKLVQRGITADQVTTSGLVAAGVGAFAFLTSRISKSTLALIPAAAGARITANALDGLVAQATHGGRPEGELFNETADRIGDAIFLLGSSAVPGVGITLPAVALASAELASFVGVSAKAAGGTRRYDGPMGKPDRMAVLSAACLIAAKSRKPHVWIKLGLAVIAAGSLATAVNRYRIAQEELQSQTPEADTSPGEDAI